MCISGWLVRIAGWRTVFGSQTRLQEQSRKVIRPRSDGSTTEGVDCSYDDGTGLGLKQQIPIENHLPSRFGVFDP